MLSKKVSFRNKVSFTSLGCARNLVDTEVMIGILLKAGYVAEESPKKADFHVVNTCGFLEAARQEAIDTLERLFSEKKKTAKVVVAGCMVQKYGALLKEKFPDIHYFLGSGDTAKVLEAITSLEQGEEITSAKSFLQWGEVPRVRATPKHFAYLKIAEGCKKRCSFCIIPTIKGPLKSKTDTQVIQEFRTLLSEGVKEVILIAQDLGDFGKDRKEKQALHSLLQKMLQEPGDFWIRLLYLYPDEIDDELIALIRSDKRICPYLDMPMQHINDRILKLMHRRTSKQELLDTIGKLRREIPEIVIRTSLMVGFPSETEEEFLELAEFVKTQSLDNIGIFSFSPEKDAFASRLKGQIPEEVKLQRHEELSRIQLASLQENQQKHIGRRYRVLVEGFHKETDLLITGRYYGQCPEVDGVIILNDPTGVRAFHEFYDVEITGVADVDLIGRVIQPLANKRRSSLSLVN